MPTPEEWSAIFGATAVVALGFAWYQIRQVDQSNLALIASNDEARRVNVEGIRPRVEVSLNFERSLPKKRGDPAYGTIFVEVKNVGVAPALNLKLSVNEPFDSLGEFFKEGQLGVHFDGLNRVFDGSVHFSRLNANSSYIWTLGRFPRLTDDKTLRIRRWVVRAVYESTLRSEAFTEEFVLDLDIEGNLRLPVDPLLRIGRDIEVVGDKLQAIKAALPKEPTLTSASLTRLHSRYVGRVPAGRSRRRPAWARRNR